ncbi:MAG: hypothetical protein GY847_01915 [Proteobacteria bacterium]|nr:hypothetical protein [Pseudomonadota bacterium]
MENKKSQTESWQVYYEHAQQLYEAGDQEQAQAYYDHAQQLYEASDDEISSQAEATERTPQAPENIYTDINSVTPSVPPPSSEKPISDTSLKQWVNEYSSVNPDAFDHNQRPVKQKTLLLSAAGLAVLIIVSVGGYIYKFNQPTIIKSVPPISQSKSTIDENQFHSSKPSSINNSRDQSRRPAAKRTKPRRGRTARKAKPNDSLTSPKQKKQKHISDDPLANFEL